MASLRTTVQNFTNYATGLDASLSTTLKTVNDNQDHVNLAVKLLYGLTIGIACVMMLSVLLIAFCDRVKCRYLLYGTCVLLFFIGTLGFLLSVVFSVAAPAVFFGCQFMDYSFSSSANFNCTCSLIQLTLGTSFQTPLCEATSLLAFPAPQATL